MRIESSNMNKLGFYFPDPTHSDELRGVSFNFKRDEVLACLGHPYYPVHCRISDLSYVEDWIRPLLKDGPLTVLSPEECREAVEKMWSNRNLFRWTMHQSNLDEDPDWKPIGEEVFVLSGYAALERLHRDVCTKPPAS